MVAIDASSAIVDGFVMPRSRSYGSVAVSVIAALVAACHSGEPPGRRAAEAAATAPAQPPVEVARQPRAYPAVGTDARPGETVLVAHQAPEVHERMGPLSGTPAQRAAAPIARVIDNEKVVFVPARVVATGASSSTVADADGTNHEVPNAAMIRVPADAVARPGNLVLTSAHNPDCGLQLAYVWDGGTPSAPRATLIMNQMFASDADGIRTTLPQGSFVPLGGPFSPGTSVAVRRPDGSYVHRVVLRADGDTVLALRRGGRLAIEERARCVPMPVRAEVRRGQTIYAPAGGEELVRAKVDSEVTQLGMVSVGIPYKRQEGNRHIRGKNENSVGFSMFLPNSPKDTEIP